MPKRIVPCGRFLSETLFFGAWLFSFFAAVGTAETLVFVAPDGNDRFSGTIPRVNAEKSDGPIQTLAEAVRRIEKIRQGPTRLTEPVAVELANGVYELSETLALTPSVSGTPDAPTVFRAAPGARPVISGGRTLHGFHVGDDGRWRVTLDDVKNGNGFFQQLFVNNQRRFRPRLPKDSDYRIAERIAAPALPGQWKGDRQFRFSDEEIRADWKNLNDVEILAFHHWTMSRQRIGSVGPGNIVTALGEPILVEAAVTHISGEGNEEKRTVLPAAPENSPWGVYIPGNRYFSKTFLKRSRNRGSFISTGRPVN